MGCQLPTRATLLQFALLFGVAICPLVHASSLNDGSESVEKSEQKEREAVCNAVPRCLEILARPHSSPQERYWAKIYLDDHATADVVDAIARLLSSDLLKMRGTAWWYAQSHPAAWRGHLDQLVEALAKDPGYAYLVADIGRAAAWAPLERLARQSPKADEYAEALRRIDETRAVDLGFKAIADLDDEIVDPDGMVRGIFKELYADDAADAATAKLTKILLGKGPVEQRRRAVLALSAMQSPVEDPPEAIRRVYATAPEPVRVEIASTYGLQVVPPEELATVLASRIGQASPRELSELAAAGPAARSLSGLVAQQIDTGTVEDRYFAMSALFEVDPEAWRSRLPRLSKDPDISIALSAIEEAKADGEASLGIAMNGLQQHWYPGLARMSSQDVIRLVSDESESAGNDETLNMIVSNDAQFAPPLAALCGADTTLSARHSRSVWHKPETIDLATRYADVTDHYVVAALRAKSGWLAGLDKGEFGGEITYTPDGEAGYSVERVSAEPLVIFKWHESYYAVVGGAYAKGGSWARLDRLLEADGKFKVVPLINLPAVPLDVIDRGDHLLVRLKDNGWVDLSDPGAPKWLACKLD